jgi:peptidase A4-like protein
MSKYQMIYNAPIAACAAILMSGLAVPASAQTAPEQGFTIAPNVETPIMLQTQPDAACDLHVAGVTDPTQNMRLYANQEGYVRFHVRSKQDAEEVRVHLDCGGAVYPLLLRAGSAPTAAMPMPQTVMPVPRGSQVLPALTEQDAKLLSDDDLIARGYPLRPDAEASPGKFANWLDLVSRPLTVLPPHTVTRSDVTHLPGVEAGTTGNYANWSGLEARGPRRSFMAVTADWNVPAIAFGENGVWTYSAFWVGLDGDLNALPAGPAASDLVQAGTEQDVLQLSGTFAAANYYAWTEIVPNQPEQTVFNLNPGDSVEVEVWIGDASGAIDQNGAYGHFRITDYTQGQTSISKTPLNGTPFVGSEAEWIMERTCISKCLTAPVYGDLSAYLIATMQNAAVLPTTGSWKTSGKASNVQIEMVNGKDRLSSVIPAPPSSVLFQWGNFH